ncbi:EamA family transporter RarD [Corynebacterium sp.]|uniref:EamA family transporter RarD n=1 Tax=Corynebacterium sp. TaxID=1720 RepID=UPI0026DBC70D|nr:EamA family transporter RarD [Corynebacterium sp.]MDO4609144.1 EamA family transporter RarD [Corynebacterium sp.]
MLYGLATYLLWGVFPLYFPLLKPAAPLEILAHRFVWTAVVMGAVVLVTGAWRQLARASARTWGLVLAAAIVIGVNWGTYVLAVNSGHVAEAALGYFINPLVSVLLGVVFLREQLTRAQLAAVALAVVAVIVLTIGVGRPPWISLTLAFSFGFYGLIKKRVPLGSAASVAAEALVLTPVALGYLVFLGGTGEGTFTTEGPAHTLLLISAGIATGVPLLLFGAAAKRVTLTSLGLMQYITPLLQMLIAVFVVHEHISPERWIGFAIIWVAVVVFTVDMLVRARSRRRARRAAGATGAAGAGTA